MLKNLRLGQVLIETGYITEQQLEEALEYQKNSSMKKMLGDVLVELGYITEEDRLKALSTRMNVRIMDFDQLKSTIEAISLVPREIAERLMVIPLRVDQNNLVLATDNPLNYYGFEELETLTGKQVVPALASKADVEEAIKRNYVNKTMISAIDDVHREYTGETDTNVSESFQQMMDRVDSSPVVKLANTIVIQACSMRASDIHIEPCQNNIRIRFRIDGDLMEAMVLNTTVLVPITTRFKIMGGLDIAERRVPQDGRFSQTVGNKNINFRISTLPSVFGEKIVVRILGDNAINIVQAKELGMSESNYQKFEKLLANPNGIIMVTGPTGSGKTTTIYSALHELSRPDVNVVTIEDPVEKYIKNVTQVHINTKAGLTFAAGLRSIMRQDPDIIMVGEVRDQETAVIAAQAAITGHLVLTSIHTNDAASAFMRLIDMGVEPYIVASSVIGVVSQRLVKVICEDCKTEYTPSVEELLQWSTDRPMPEKFYHGAGCKNCNHTGYRGRTAVHEIIMVSPDLRNLIMKHASAQDIKRKAKEYGFTDLKENLMDLIVQGRTTMEQMIKVANFIE